MSKLDKFAFQFLKVQLTVVKTLKPSKYPVKFLPLEADLQELLISFRSFLLLDVCLFGDHWNLCSWDVSSLSQCGSYTTCVLLLPSTWPVRRGAGEWSLDCSSEEMCLKLSCWYAVFLSCVFLQTQIVSDFGLLSLTTLIVLLNPKHCILSLNI